MNHFSPQLQSVYALIHDNSKPSRLTHILLSLQFIKQRILWVYLKCNFLNLLFIEMNYQSYKQVPHIGEIYGIRVIGTLTIIE
ncbi:hypothetical protein HNQ88_001617 [Aureibacter tunicatorum]|uniref:Uncharacterized protein n=1 Tax=Aureibacter tunicatorum TaxID=866807 RepID=A0AAE3XL94_9BACT|nr:hypothetical protein [Aureibacter tunicatorum]BDD05489.1 hypothetical protein AUTU_29720 [Aureibacter tunicatorum]